MPRIIGNDLQLVPVHIPGSNTQRFNVCGSDHSGRPVHVVLGPVSKDDHQVLGHSIFYPAPRRLDEVVLHHEVQGFASVQGGPAHKPQAADGFQDSIFGLVGLQVELRVDTAAELHHPNPHFVWPHVQLLDNSADEVPNMSKPLLPNAVRAVNEEDYVLFISRNNCGGARREEIIGMSSFCFSFAGGFLCDLLSCEVKPHGIFWPALGMVPQGASPKGPVCK